MSYLTPDEHPRLTVGPFSKVPGILTLDDIIPKAVSISGSVAGSSRSFSGNPVIERAEPCLVTGSINYTHERAHWINTVRHDEDRRDEITAFIRDLHITPKNFTLDDPSNITNLDRVVHKSLDAYAFIAVTGTRETLNFLTDLVRADNDRRQQSIDEGQADPNRMIDLDEVLQHSQFELVALHPEHFLPGKSTLTVYDNASETRKTYFPSIDRKLRESPDSTSPQFPSFSGPSRIDGKLNPLLVIINAETKFRRYLRMEPPDIPLPNDVHKLMQMSKELVDLIYWEPTPMKSEGSKPRVAKGKRTRLNPSRSKRPPPKSMKEKSNSDENSDGGGMAQARKRARVKKSTGGGVSRFPWPEGADLETRVEFGSALLSLLY